MAESARGVNNVVELRRQRGSSNLFDEAAAAVLATTTMTTTWHGIGDAARQKGLDDAATAI